MAKNTQIFHWLEKTYRIILLVILGGIVIHAPMSVFFGGVVWPEFDVLIKSWKELLLLIAGGLAIILVTRARLWRELVRDWLVKLLLIYALLHVLLLFVFRDQTGALSSIAGLMIDLRYILYFGLVYVGVRLQPKFRRPFAITAGIGAAVVIGFGVLQVLVLPDDALKYLGYGANTIQPYVTIDQNPDYVRINSTLRGPNPLGAYGVIVLGLVAAAVVLRKISPTWRGRLGATLMGLGAFVVIWASYSRSALLAAITTLLFIFITTVGTIIGWKKLILALLALILVTSASLFVLRDSSFVANVILHDNPESSSVSKSNNEHLDSLIDGTERMVAQPFGAGVGSTGSASLYGETPLIIENQYLFIAHEAGWLGLALFVAIFGSILWRLWQRRADWLALGLLASGIGLSVIGLLLPVWVDDTVSLVWWGVAGAALGAHVTSKGATHGRTIK